MFLYRKEDKGEVESASEKKATSLENPCGKLWICVGKILFFAICQHDWQPRLLFSIISPVHRSLLHGSKGKESWRNLKGDGERIVTKGNLSADLIKVPSPFRSRWREEICLLGMKGWWNRTDRWHEAEGEITLKNIMSHIVPSLVEYGILLRQSWTIFPPFAITL